MFELGIKQIVMILLHFECIFLMLILYSLKSHPNPDFLSEIFRRRTLWCGKLNEAEKTLGGGTNRLNMLLRSSLALSLVLCLLLADGFTQCPNQSRLASPLRLSDCNGDDITESHLVDEIRFVPVSRRHDVIGNRLLNTKSELSKIERTTVLIATIGTNSVDLLRKVLKYYSERHYIDAELMYISIRLAVKNAIDSTIPYELLLKAFEKEIYLDVDTVNIVINALSRNLKLEELNIILDQLQRIEKVSSGDPLGFKCDMETYSLIISCATRLKNRDIMMKSFKLLEKNSNIELDEDLFLQALSVCSFQGDLVSAMSVFSLYKRFYGVVQMKAYCLLLLAHINSVKNNKVKEDYSSNNSRLLSEVTQNLESIVNFIIKSDIDNSSTVLSNLVLQHWCVQNELTKSSSYFVRMKTMGHLLSTAAIEYYSDVLCSHGDVQRGQEFYDWLVSNKYIPTINLSKMCKD